MLRILVSIAALVVLCSHLGEAHLVLVFPAPRKYELDFLQNIDSNGPCGMPKGDNAFSTSLVSGGTYNFTWMMAYPHVAGGIRIELLDSKYELVEVLIPSKEEGLTNAYFSNRSDPTTLWRVVKLPDITCTDCVVRIHRQTSFWRPQTTIGHMFRTCGDVNIAKQLVPYKKCSKKGLPVDGTEQCKCKKFTSGELCQYTDDCVTDDDCGKKRGQCIESDPLQYPKRQCWCFPGYFGRKCENYNEDLLSGISDDLLLDAAVYKHEAVEIDFDIFWRLLLESDEMEIVLRVNTSSWVAMGIRSNGAPITCRRVPGLVNESAGYTPLQAKLNRGIALPANDSDGWATMQKEIETSFPPNSFPPFLHPMACTDIIWGAAKGELSQVRDKYTVDPSMPRDDEFYEGSQSLTAATAYERNGTTTLIARRPVYATHYSDVEIEDQPMHVTHARGQHAGSTQTVLLRSLNVSLPDFYTVDALRYHSNDRGQRGYGQINFLA